MLITLLSILLILIMITAQKYSRYSAYTVFSVAIPYEVALLARSLAEPVAQRKQYTSSSRDRMSRTRFPENSNVYRNKSETRASRVKCGQAMSRRRGRKMQPISRQLWGGPARDLRRHSK